MISLCPITLREARAFVAEHHRHHAPPQGGLFAIAAEMTGREQVDSILVRFISGVAIVGRPVSRVLAEDDYLAEVTRGESRVGEDPQGATHEAAQLLVTKAREYVEARAFPPAPKPEGGSS